MMMYNTEVNFLRTSMDPTLMHFNTTLYVSYAVCVYARIGFLFLVDSFVIHMNNQNIWTTYKLLITNKECTLKSCYTCVLKLNFILRIINILSNHIGYTTHKKACVVHTD